MSMPHFTRRPFICRPFTRRPFTRRHCAQASAAVSLSVASLFSIQPAQAATLAESLGGFSFNNFSVAPVEVESSAQTFTFTAGSQADAISSADALFTLLPEAEAVNAIASSAFSDDGASNAFAESEASIIGDFAIKAGETLSFDFSGVVDLFTFTEQPTERATAVLETQYSIFDVGSSATLPIELDFFNVFGEINTPNGLDDFGIDGSESIALGTPLIVDNTGPTQPVESLLIEVAGQYKRLFEKDADLTLVEIKLGQALANRKEAVDIPDASSPWLGLLVLGGVLFLNKQSARRNTPFLHH